MSKPDTTKRVEPDQHHAGRWNVVNDLGEDDGWSYPSRAAAEDAIADPEWAHKYAIQEPSNGKQ